MTERDLFLTELFRREYQDLARKAYRLTGSTEAAEDLLQEVFLLATVRYSEFRGHPSPRAWLSVVLYRLAGNYWRLAENTREVPLEDVLALPAGEPIMPLSDSLPKGLTDEERQILIWRFEERLDYRDISSKLGVPEGACRMRVSRAVKKCAKLMAREKKADKGGRKHG